MNTQEEITNLLVDALAHHFDHQNWTEIISYIDVRLESILTESKDEIESFNRIGDMEFQARLLNELRDLKLYAAITISGIAILITMIVFYA